MGGGKGGRGVSLLLFPSCSACETCGLFAEQFRKAVQDPHFKHRDVVCPASGRVKSRLVSLCGPHSHAFPFLCSLPKPNPRDLFFALIFVFSPRFPVWIFQGLLKFGSLLDHSIASGVSDPPSVTEFLFSGVTDWFLPPPPPPNYFEYVAKLYQFWSIGAHMARVTPIGGGGVEGSDGWFSKRVTDWFFACGGKRSLRG